MDDDLIISAIDESAAIYQDVKADLEDGKLTFVEGTGLVLKHAIPAVKFVSSIVELGKQIEDLDQEEAGHVIDEIASKYGNGNTAASEAAKKILQGLTLQKDGIKELIALKK